MTLDGMTLDEIEDGRGGRSEKNEAEQAMKPGAPARGITGAPCP